MVAREILTLFGGSFLWKIITMQKDMSEFIFQLKGPCTWPFSKEVKEFKKEKKKQLDVKKSVKE